MYRKITLAGLLLLFALNAFAGVPRSKHIFVIILENQSYERIVGSSNAPYLNSLVPKGALATQFYATVHGSQLVRQYLYAGVGIGDSVTTCFTEDNLVRQMLPLALRWKSYNEGLPYAGDWVTSYNYYVRRHNVLTDWTDTCASSQRYNSVPFGDSTRGFWHDASNHTFANFNDVDPNLIHDMHSPTTDPGLAIRNGDSWLKSHVPAILSQPYFQTGGDGQLWIIFDEGNIYPTVDTRNGGGRVMVLLLGPKAAKGHRSATFHNDQNLLRTWGISMGFATLPGGASKAGSLWELFVQ
jgi:acid phosphatase